MWRAIYHEFRRRAKASEIASATFRRTEITVETDRIWIIRKSQTTRGWCAECGREVDIVELKKAGVVPGKNPQALTAQPMLPGCGDSRGWHWSQGGDGSLRVCLESVVKPQ
ncbi:MAG: hypothetical protein ABSD75_29720 [Terriglobales bacterium]|jgi:hypothetical protein